MYDRRMPSRSTRVFAACLALAAAPALGGCSDHGKASEEKATHAIEEVKKRAEADVKDLEVGLPAATAKLAPLFAQGAEPSGDLSAVRKALRQIRAEVPELTRSSSTFFALTDSHGIAIRNDLDQDVMAGQDVWKLFPALAPKPGADAPAFASAAGLFAGARAPGDPDRDWVAATPLKDAKGAFAGMLIGGWTLRRFAYHLEEAFRHDLIADQAKTKDPGKLPIVYVGVFDASGVYAAPNTPAVNRQALVDLGLVAKTAAGPVHGVLSITDRDFGYAATRIPALEADGGVVVLWSEI
jgi:hypothetical protein